jgi:hypothetical protein
MSINRLGLKLCRPARLTFNVSQLVDYKRCVEKWSIDSCSPARLTFNVNRKVV